MSVYKFTHPNIAEKDHEWVTTCGKSVTQVTSFDVSGAYNIVGVIEGDLYYFDDLGVDTSIMEYLLIDKPKEYSYWLKIYKDGSVAKYNSKKEAKKFLNKDIVRAIININYKEGEGLEA